MIIDLANAGKTRSLELEIGPGEIDVADEFRLTGNVMLTGELNTAAERATLRGAIRARVEVDCSRCLEPVERDLEIAFEDAFVKALPDDAEAELAVGDLDESLIEGDEIDLTEVAREQILLNIPEQVLCSEDCKGLCSKCGANLNLIDCNCKENDIDPRWSALKNLK